MDAINHPRVANKQELNVLSFVTQLTSHFIGDYTAKMRTRRVDKVRLTGS